MFFSGQAQSEMLPYNKYLWLSRKEIEETNFLETNCEDKTGYILEVDLEYPEYLHKSYNNLYNFSFNIVAHKSDKMMTFH